MSDVLAGIAAYKSIDVAARKAATSHDAIESLARAASSRVLQWSVLRFSL